MLNLKSTYKLNNGIQIPMVGFGTWQTPNGETAISAVEEALKAGYRHIDTAAIYRNEESVGTAIKNSGLKREEIFVTSKVWNSEQGYETTLKAFEESLRKLQLDYMDLYLIHWPVPKIFKENWQEVSIGTWKAMEELYKAGKVKAIGVSNFNPHHIKNLIDNCEIVPMVNQIQLSPGLDQKETIDYCLEKNIVIEAYSPLSTGKIFNVKEIIDMANKYNKSVSQIALRWSIQNGYLPLPKSVTPSRIKENLEIFDFEISKEDMEFIDNLTDTGATKVDSDNINF